MNQWRVEIVYRPCLVEVRSSIEPKDAEARDSEDTELCTVNTLAEAKEHAESLAADYGDGARLIIMEITITHPGGWVEYVVARDSANAVKPYLSQESVVWTN